MLKWAARVLPPNEAHEGMTAYRICSMIAASVASGVRLTGDNPRGDIEYAPLRGRGQGVRGRAARRPYRGRGDRGRRRGPYV